MATIDLGKLGFVNKGTYSSSTSYEKNDLVQYTDSGILSTYLYINASAATGQTPSTSGTVNGTYWAYYAKGAAAYSSTLTTQGDILYHNGSGEARLAAGTSGQVLQTGGSGANPSWTTITSDVVKLVEYTVSSAVTSFSLTNWVSSTYKHYEVRIDGLSFTSANDSPIFRWINSSGSQVSSTQYRWAAMHPYVGSGSTNYNHHGAVSDKFTLHTNTTGTDHYLFGYLQFGYEALKSGTQPAFQYQLTQRESGDQQQSYQGFCWYTGNVDITGSSAGFVIDRNGSGSFDNGTVTIYGMK